jgi:hypothetical protein
MKSFQLFFCEHFIFLFDVKWLDTGIKNKGGILNWISEHDIVVVDRGFRDSTGMMKALGLDECMSDLLNVLMKPFRIQQFIK